MDGLAAAINGRNACGRQDHKVFLGVLAEIFQQGCFARARFAGDIKIIAGIFQLFETAGEVLA